MSEAHHLLRAGDCDTVLLTCFLLPVNTWLACQLRQLGSNMRGNTLQSALRSLCHTVCGFHEKKNKCEAEKRSVQPEQKLPKQQRREDDTSFILCTAVNSDDSVEEEKTEQRRWPTWRWRERERENENERESRPWPWFLFMVCLSMHVSVVSCPQPLLKIHTEWEMYLTGGSVLNHHSHVMLWAASEERADVCFSALSLLG